ncbi:MAG: hypothetical protein IJ286_04150 [Alistipes sp.]|nr:hypothetical protein [Alistipes sp.]
MAVRSSTIHRWAFYVMHTYYRILTTNWFYRDSGTPSPYPSNPRMGNTQSMSHPGCFHDMPNLHHSDDKTVHRLSGVQTPDDKIVHRVIGVQTLIRF